MGAHEIVNSAIARMFYTGGLSFHFARILIMLVP